MRLRGEDEERKGEKREEGRGEKRCSPPFSLSRLGTEREKARQTEKGRRLVGNANIRALE